VPGDSEVFWQTYDQDFEDSLEHSKRTPIDFNQISHGIGKYAEGNLPFRGSEPIAHSLGCTAFFMPKEILYGIEGAPDGQGKRVFGLWGSAC